MPGPTDTIRYPEVAVKGIVIVIDVPLQELIVTGASFSRTWLLPCVAPNPLPEITAWLPTPAKAAEITGPPITDTLVRTGAGAADELIETLSKVAVLRVELLWLVTAKPILTLWAMLMVWVVPTCTQVTPSADMYPLKEFPLLTTFVQYGRLIEAEAWPVLPPVLVRTWKIAWPFAW